MYKIIIWGTGKRAKELLDRLNLQNVSILCFVDNAPKMQGTKFENIAEVAAPCQLRGSGADYDLLILASSFAYEIRRQCEELGLADTRLISDDMTMKTIHKYRGLYKQDAMLELYETEWDQIDKNQEYLQELLWRDTFRDTVRGYEWFAGNCSLSLGRWAIGYNFAYVLARCLEEFKPKTMLELGLGQSSKIINCYAAYEKQQKNAEISYEVVEQDREWSQFFKNREDKENDNITMRHMNIIETRRDGGALYQYENFKEQMSGRKFDFISIDGPWGGDYISRTDVLECLPAILEQEFVILMDDCERTGERRMAQKMEQKLSEQNILFHSGTYRSIKNVHLIASEHWKFLTTL